MFYCDINCIVFFHYQKENKSKIMDIHFKSNVQNMNKEASLVWFKTEISSYAKVLVSYAKTLLYLWIFIIHGLPFSILAPLFTRHRYQKGLKIYFERIDSTTSILKDKYALHLPFWIKHFGLHLFLFGFHRYVLFYFMFLKEKYFYIPFICLIYSDSIVYKLLFSLSNKCLKFLPFSCTITLLQAGMSNS